jgi:pimeloyl-ACP methyl ester carboxylesterase
MLARIQQAISLLLLGLLVALLTSAWHHGWNGWRVAGLALLLGGHAAVLGVEFVLMRRLHRRATGETIPWGTVARAWAREIRFAVPTFLWRQPWRWREPPDHLQGDLRGRTGVVLVHGFICNRGLWLPWLERLRARGVPFAAVSLEPVFGSIDDYPPLVEDAVRRVEAATGRPPILVAHSMGGLAVRAWLRDFAADDRVARVITIGTPHGGTWIAGQGRGENARQMRLGNPWLRALADAEPAARAQRFTCWWSECDQIVGPSPTAVLPGSEARRLHGRAHVEMAGDETIWADLCARLGVPAR